MADDRVLIVDGAQHHKWTQETFEDIRQGDISAVNITLAIWENARETLAEIGQWYRRFDQFSDLIMPVYTSDDIRAAYEAKKTGILFGFQNTSPLEDNIEFVAVFAKLGVRVMQLTYNTQNLIGCGCYEPNDSGLTYFGADVIAEMNRHGVVIDLSHTGERTSMDAIEASTQPVAITHANPTWWKDVQRNKSDDMMRALAENGGVMGLGTYPKPLRPRRHPGAVLRHGRPHRRLHGHRPRRSRQRPQHWLLTRRKALLGPWPLVAGSAKVHERQGLPQPQVAPGRLARMV